MKKVTYAAMTALASLFVAGATASAADTTSATDSLSGLTSSLGGLSSSTSSTSSLGGASKTSVVTNFVDVDGKTIAPTVDGIVAAVQVEGYTLLRSTTDENGNLTYVYTGATTVNFTANFNDGTPAAKFTWNFPANTAVTYAKLFEMAGLNANDFDLSGYDMTGNIGDNH